MPRPASPTTNTAYAVMWMNTPDIVHTLVYRPPTGPEVRTYYEGHLDSRAGDESEFTRFDDPMDAMSWMIDNPGDKCLVDVTAARKLYGSGHEKFAEPV